MSSRMAFVANLRPATVDALVGDLAAGNSTRGGGAAFLLSAHRARPALVQQARLLVEGGHRLFADNGTKPRITGLVADFAQEATPLRLAYADLTRALGRLPRGRDVPPSLRSAAADLADRVVHEADVRARAVDGAGLLAVQRSMDPTDVIAEEDFAVAALLSLGLGRELTGWSVDRIASRSRASLRRWSRVATHPSMAGRRSYAVLSAVDHVTAVHAGRDAARAGVTHVALGVAGFSADRSLTDSHVVGTGIVGLGGLVARRHVRLVEVVRGIRDGFALAGAQLAGFHALGLGSPYLLPLLRAAASEVPDVTADATSPIHDAVRDAVLYDHTQLGQRRSIPSLLADVLLARRSWRCDHAACRAFMDAEGHDEPGARSAWLASGRPRLGQPDLRIGHPVAQHVPYFWRTPDERGSASRRSQVAHNHLVLDQIAAAVPDAEAALARLAKLIALPGRGTTDAGLRAGLAVLDRLQGRPAHSGGARRAA